MDGQQVNAQIEALILGYEFISINAHYQDIKYN